MASLGEVIVKFGADIGDFQQSVSTVTKTLDGVGRNFDSISSRLSGAGTALTAAITAPIVGIGLASSNAYMDFEQSMAGIRSVTSLTAPELEALKQKAITLGADTKYSATEAANGMKELGAAGFNTGQIMAAAAPMLDLAAAGELGVADAAELAANTLGQFNLSAEDTGHVADVLVLAANSAQTNVRDLGEAMKYSGGLASAAGVNFDTTAAALAIMSESGLKGSMAGTSLSAAIREMINPSRQQAAVMNDLGLSFTDATGKLLPFESIIEQVRTKVTNAQDKIVLFGTEGVRSIEALASSQTSLSEFTSQLQNADGSAKKAADTLNNTLIGKMEQFKGAVETAGIQIGEALAPAIGTLLELLISLADKAVAAAQWFGSLPEPIQTTALVIIGLAAAIGPLLLGLAGLASAFSTIVTLPGAFSAALVALKTVAVSFGAVIGTSLTAVLSAAIPVIMAIAGAFAAFKLGEWLYNNVQWIKEFIDWIGKMLAKLGQVTGISNAVSSAWSKLTGAAKDVKKAVDDKVSSFTKTETVTKNVKSASVDLGSELGKMRTSLNDTKQSSDEYKAKLKELQDEKKTLQTEINNNSTGWLALQQTSKNLMTDYNNLKQSIVNLKVSLLEGKDAIWATNTAATDADTLFKNLQASIGNTTTDIKSLTVPAITSMSTEFQNLSTDVTDCALNVDVKTESMKTSFGGFTNAVSTSITNFSQDISKALFDGDTSWGEKGKKMLSALGGAVSSTFIEPATKAINDFITGAISKLLSGEGLGGVLTSIKDIGEGIGKIFGSGASAATGAAGSATGAAGSVGGIGGVASGAIGGALGAAGAIGSVVSAVSGVISNFQLARQENTLNAIEWNTRKSSLHLEHSLTQFFIPYLPALTGIHERWVEFLNNHAFRINDTYDNVVELKNETIKANYYLDAIHQRLNSKGPDVQVTITNPLLLNDANINMLASQISKVISSEIQSQGIPV